jgi:hypothetical protein
MYEKQAIASCGYVTPARAWLLRNTNPFSYTLSFLLISINLLEACGKVTWKHAQSMHKVVNIIHTCSPGETNSHTAPTNKSTHSKKQSLNKRSSITTPCNRGNKTKVVFDGNFNHCIINKGLRAFDTT